MLNAINAMYGFQAISETSLGGIAVGDSGTLISSVDAISWTQRTSSFGSIKINSVVKGAAGYVAVGNFGKIASSTDGITWSQRSNPFSSSDDVYAVAWNGSVFFAVSPTGKGAVSVDGVSWTLKSIVANAVNISAGGSTFCIICAGVVTAISADNGNTWSVGAFPGSGENWTNSAWNGSIFCAIANKANTYECATSSDGVTWVGNNNPPTSDLWGGIAWNGSIFCAVSSGSTASVISADGVSWSSGGTLPSSGWDDIVWSAGLGVFIAVGNAGGLVTSPDGTVWTSRSSGVSVRLNGVCPL